MELTISIKRLYDKNKRENGIIITSHTVPENAKDRYEMETIMKHHVHSKIFPGEGLVFYPSVEKEGLISFISLIGINKMEEIQEKINYSLSFSTGSEYFNEL